MHIRTELSNSERFGNDGATIYGGSRHSVNTRISINRVLVGTIRPAIGNCVKSICNQHSAVTVANNVVASNGQETRQSVNRIIGCNRNRRNTTIGINNFGFDKVCTRDLVGKNQRVKVVTRNFNTINIPNERTSGSRSSREDNLIIRTNGTSLGGLNRRSSRNRIDINHNSIRVGTATIRSFNIIQSISSRRSHINSRIVRTGVPGINNIGIKNIAEICSQSHVLTFANVGSGSCDVHIRTKGVNSESDDIGLTTICALGNNRVETRNSIISICSSKSTSIPRILGCTISGSSELRRGTVTNNLRTVDGKNRRSGFNRHRNSLGNRRDTTVGVDDTSGDTVNASVVAIQADRTQILTRNFNTVHIPNEGCSGIRGSGDSGLSVLTHRHGSGGHRRSRRNSIHINYNSIRVGTATIGSLNIIHSIGSRRSHINSRIVRTGVPSINDIGINKVAQIGSQSHVCTFANISSGSSDVHIRTKGVNSESDDIGLTTICALGNNRVETRNSIISICSSKSTSIPRILGCTISGSSELRRGTVTNNLRTVDGKNRRSGFNRHRNSLGNRRDTTVGVDDTSGDTVNASVVAIQADRTQILTRNFNTVHIPNEGCSGSGGSGDSSLSVLTHRHSSGGHRRSRRNCIHRKFNRIRIGATTVRSLHVEFLLRSSRNNRNRRVVGTRAPSVNHIGINNTIQVGTQHNRLSFANISNRCIDVQIRTKRNNIERDRIGNATIGALGNHRVETRSSIIGISSTKSTTIPRILCCAISGSGKLSGGTVTNKLRTVDGENRRSRFNRHRDSFGSRRNTAIGIDDASGDAINAGIVAIQADRTQVLTGNFNTVHIPNEGCGGIRSCSDSSLRVLTHCHSCGRDCRSCGKCFQSKLDRVRIRTTTIRGLYKIFIICSGRENCDGGVMGTRAPSVNHIGINSATQIGAQHNRFATACINGGSDNVKISTDRSDGKGNGIRHTTIGALGNHSVDTRNSFES